MQRGIYCNVQCEPHQSSASIVLYEILFLPLVKEPVKPLTQAEPPHPTLSRLFFFFFKLHLTSSQFQQLKPLLKWQASR